MQKRTVFIICIVLAFFVSGPCSGVAKEIKVLSQFPMSGPVGSLPEFGWGYIEV